MKYLVALDQGTTSSRAIVFDQNGQTLAAHAIEFPQHYPQPGWVEHDPEDILNTQVEALRKAVEMSKVDVRDIAAIGITNQRETTLLWEKDTGRCLHNAIVWQCRRTAPYVEKLVAQGYSDMIRRKTGLVPDAYFSATKLAYLLDTLNLRERATGESPSWGVYNARVKLLGEKPGKQAPWVHVRVGNIDGWVSGNYVHRRGKGDQMHVYSTAATVHPVGRARTETALMRMPGGEAVMQLKPDTYAHVLGERDGWLHIILPRGEMMWQTDWDGTYGFVRAKDVAVGVSMTDAKYMP